MFLRTSRFEKNGRAAGLAKLASPLIAFALGLPACADDEESVSTNSSGLAHIIIIEGGGGGGSGGSGGGSGGGDGGTGSGGSDAGTDGGGSSDAGGGSSDAGTSGGSDAGTDSGGYDAGTGSGGYDAGTGSGGYDAGTGSGGYDAGTGSGGYDAGTGSGGYDAGTGSGGSCGDADCNGYDDCSFQPSGCTYVPPCGDANCDGYDDCNGQPSTYCGCGDLDCNGYDDCSYQPSGCILNCGDANCDGYDDCSGQPSPYSEYCTPPELSLCEIAHRKALYCLADSGDPSPIDYTFATMFVSHLLGPSIAPGIQMRDQPVVLWQPQELTQQTSLFVNDFVTLHAEYPSSPFPSTTDWQSPSDPNDPLFQRIANECASLEAIGRWPTLQDWPSMVADITSPPMCSLFAEQFGDGYFANAQRVEPMAQDVPEPQGPLAPPEPFPTPRHAAP